MMAQGSSSEYALKVRGCSWGRRTRDLLYGGWVEEDWLNHQHAEGMLYGAAKATGSWNMAGRDGLKGEI